MPHSEFLDFALTQVLRNIQHKNDTQRPEVPIHSSVTEARGRTKHPANHILRQLVAQWPRRAHKERPQPFAPIPGSY